MTELGAEPEIERPSRRRWPSLVWTVPLLAVIAAVGLLFQTLATRGPKIEIVFPTASGLTAGETVVKYRDVTVGLVERVRFSGDLSEVVAEVRMDKTVAPFLDASAVFWVVRPEVSARGITGLETVISGSYIEASWDREPGPRLDRFTAADRPPVTPEGTPGLRIRLRAEDGGSLEIGSPIFFKRVEVGTIEGKRLTEDGSAVEFDAFIRAPNARRITRSTRFWNVSGVDLQLGTDGARLRIASLASLVRGGASFETGDDPTPVEPGHLFRLYSSESEAVEAQVPGGPEDQVPLDILFDGSVRGLRAGASVEYRGIRVGRVDSVTAAIERSSGQFRTRTRIGLSPALLGLEEGDRGAVLDYLRTAVENGLRAKLAMGSLLTGALYVNLAEAPDARPETIDESGEVPVLPSLPSDLDELTGSVEGVLDRVSALPVEALMANAVTLLENVNRIVASDEVRTVPARVVDLLEAAEALVGAPELRRTAEEAEALVRSLRTLAQDPSLTGAPREAETLLASLAALVADLERAGAVENAGAGLAALRTLVENPELARVPGELNRTLGAATGLLESAELAALPGEINATLATLRGTLDLPGLEALPGDVSAALASLRNRLDDPALAEALAELVPLLRASRETAETVATVGADLGPALAALTRLLEDPATRAAPDEMRATIVAARELLEDRGLRRASAEAADTLAALRVLLEAPDTRAAPAELAATLAAARGLLASLVEAEAAENLSATLEATRRLADDPALRRTARELADTLAALRAVLTAPGVEDLPAATRDALASAAALIDQFQQENLGAAATGALAGIADAGRAVERSVAGLPALLRRMGEVAARADALLASVSVGSELNYETVATIREMRDAARAVADLADLVQRNPNAFILGK